MTDNSKEQSPCEAQCQSQQAALTACMTSIQDAREMAFQQSTDKGDDSSVDISKVDTSCLAPSIASWTECCSKANNGGVEVNQGHIGIH